MAKIDPKAKKAAPKSAPAPEKAPAPTLPPAGPVSASVTPQPASSSPPAPVATAPAAVPTRIDKAGCVVRLALSPLSAEDNARYGTVHLWAVWPKSMDPCRPFENESLIVLGQERKIKDILHNLDRQRMEIHLQPKDVKDNLGAEIAALQAAGWVWENEGEADAVAA